MRRRTDNASKQGPRDRATRSGHNPAHRPSQGARVNPQAGKRTRASEALGISVRTLRNKIRDYAL